MAVLEAVLIFLGFFGLIILFSAIRIVMQYEVGLVFTLGRFSNIRQPGLNFIVPIFQSLHKVDMRIKTLDVPSQDAMTKDNVSVKINAVVYYKVADSKRAIIEVEDYNYATSQVAQTTMRDVVGSVVLDELLSRRDEVSRRIQKLVDEATDPWGVKVTSVDLKHIELPQDMVRVMAKQAEAEREKRAVIIKAEGEVVASDNLTKAAKVLAKSRGALHLRTLQTINDVSSDQSNTIIFAIPLEVLRAFEAVGDWGKKDE
ncbi:MAG: slipin family protein [Candidatus Altiarchaeota archaeon]|nr:slipin family protein [Candidatus Altiarchaeota archaeon]